MVIAGIFDKYTSEIFKFLGVKTIAIDLEDTNLASKLENLLLELKKDKNIFAVLISKNISSKTRKEIEDFILNNSRPAIIEVDPVYKIEKYEDYETIIKRIVRETIGLKL
ncbi:MAG: V-type ATP synthase subunit F [Brevinematia bacterium]